MKMKRQKGKVTLTPNQLEEVDRLWNESMVCLMRLRYLLFPEEEQELLERLGKERIVPKPPSDLIQ